MVSNFNSSVKEIACQNVNLPLRSLKVLDLDSAPCFIIFLLIDTGGCGMTIKEVTKMFDISADTLRYYERVGVIPAVGRTESGIRNYTEEDLEWIKTAICFRSAGMPVESLIEYTRLFREGDSTISARRDLLLKTRDDILAEVRKYEEALNKLDYKIAKYNEAVETGVLNWYIEDTCV